MIIGVIYTAFNTTDLVESSLRPWMDAQVESLGGHQYVICAVSVPFAGFPLDSEDNTTDKLRFYRDEDYIQHVIDEPRNISEAEARSMALTWLKGRGVDVTIQVDSDEEYTPDDIVNIFRFVESQPFVTWFRLSLKNYVFDDKHYLIEPFTPPRIHRMRSGGFEAARFVGDNNIRYLGYVAPQINRPLAEGDFSSMTVPASTAWIRHLTWQNNDRSRRKIEYQLKGRGWPQCSFSWDDAQGGLIFNPALPAPAVWSD